MKDILISKKRSKAPECTGEKVTVKGQMEVALKQSSLTPRKTFMEDASFTEKRSRVRLISHSYFKRLKNLKSKISKL